MSPWLTDKARGEHPDESKENLPRKIRTNISFFGLWFVEDFHFLLLFFCIVLEVLHASAVIAAVFVTLAEAEMQ